MKGVFFDKLHSYDDLNLILSKVVIEPPEVKTKKIDVPGSDGSIDLTQFDGNIHYYNRKILFNFSVCNCSNNWTSIFSEVNNKLHGKEMNVILDEEPDFFWHGRVTVKEHTKKRTIGNIEIELDAEPYKNSMLKSTDEIEWDSFNFESGILQCLKDITVEGSKEVEVFGYRKNVVPVIEVTGTISVLFNGVKTELSEGKNKVLNVTIKEGYNLLIFTGNGTVSVDFRGGVL